VLENAAQYAQSDASISISVATTASELTIRVRDHGPGISPEELPRLFDRFYRGRHAKRHSVGTGMGLSIASGLLAAQGGRISADNAADGGAVFTIAVPVEHLAKSEAAS